VGEAVRPQERTVQILATSFRNMLVERFIFISFVFEAHGNWFASVVYGLEGILITVRNLTVTPRLSFIEAVLKLNLQRR